MREIHTIAPLYDKNSVVLILGSFPSVKSREGNFFYHHPQNRFWKVIPAVLGQQTPITTEQKRRLLHDNRIALWDVIKSCDIENSSDSSIKNVEVNDLSVILNAADIKAIFTNGGKSSRLYKKYCQNVTGIEAHPLPSTSPANAGWSLERLTKEWSIVKDFIFDKGLDNK